MEPKIERGDREIRALCRDIHRLRSTVARCVRGHLWMRCSMGTRSCGRGHCNVAGSSKSVVSQIKHAVSEIRLQAASAKGETAKSILSAATTAGEDAEETKAAASVAPVTTVVLAAPAKAAAAAARAAAAEAASQSQQCYSLTLLTRDTAINTYMSEQDTAINAFMFRRDAAINGFSSQRELL